MPFISAGMVGRRHRTTGKRKRRILYDRRIRQKTTTRHENLINCNSSRDEWRRENVGEFGYRSAGAESQTRGGDIHSACSERGNFKKAKADAISPNSRSDHTHTQHTYLYSRSGIRDCLYKSPPK